MLTILIIEDSSQLGGVQHSTINFLNESINDKDVRLILLLPENGPLVEICIKLSIEYYLYERPKPISTSFYLFGTFFQFPNPYALFRALTDVKSIQNSIYFVIESQNLQFDVVLTKGMLSHLPGGKFGRRIHKPVIWHVQDFITGRYFGFFRFVFSFLAQKYSDLLIADGLPIVNVLGKKSKLKSKVIYNGIDADLFFNSLNNESSRIQFDLSNNDFVIGNVSRFVPNKGQLLLVKAFHKLTYKYDNIKLLLIGNSLFGTDDYFSIIKNYITSNNLSDKVILPGYISDLRLAYSSMNIFVYPAIEKDTCPLSLLGALASNLPILASRIEGIYEVINEARNTDFFEVGDEIELIDKLEQFILEYHNKFMDNENYLFAKKNFDNSVFYKQIIESIRDLGL